MHDTHNFSICLSLHCFYVQFVYSCMNISAATIICNRLHARAVASHFFLLRIFWLCFSSRGKISSQRALSSIGWEYAYSVSWTKPDYRGFPSDERLRRFDISYTGASNRAILDDRHTRNAFIIWWQECFSLSFPGGECKSLEYPWYDGFAEERCVLSYERYIVAFSFYLNEHPRQKYMWVRVTSQSESFWGVLHFTLF